MVGSTDGGLHVDTMEEMRVRCSLSRTEVLL